MALTRVTRIHSRGNLPISYDELYPLMPEDELQEAQTCYARARMITENNLGRPLTGEEFRERARLYARHQTLTRKYDPLHEVKRAEYGKLYRKIQKKLKEARSK